jgi:hypothetical protein
MDAIPEIDSYINNALHFHIRAASLHQVKA